MPIFFSPIKNITIEMAQNNAKDFRVSLLKLLIDQYTHLKAIKPKDKDKDKAYEQFLSQFCQHIHTLNTCSENPEHVIQLTLTLALTTFKHHSAYEVIKARIDTCLQALKDTDKIAKSRLRTDAKNDYARINHRAWTLSTLPTLLAGACVIAYFTTPIGWPLLAVAGLASVILVLSQLIYWCRNRARYAELETQLRNDDFTPDYGSGYALDPSELPALPKKEVAPSNITTLLHARRQFHQQQTPLEVVSNVAKEVGDNTVKMLAESAEITQSLFWTSLSIIQNAVTDYQAGNQGYRKIPEPIPNLRMSN